METVGFTCSHCGYQAPLHLFGNTSDGHLKCRRCRSLVPDPHAFSADITYADCDSRRVVTRFPFQLNGRDAIVRVRPDYMALLVGNDGTQRWLTEPSQHITDLPHGFQVYYVCLKPQILWGVAEIAEFGAYGVAHLSLSQSYVKDVCNQDGHIQHLEEHLRALTCRKITNYSRTLVQRHNQSILRQSDGYISALGVLDTGVSLIRVELKGYRDGDNHPVTLAQPTGQAAAAPEKKMDVCRSPIEKAAIPKRDFRIEDGVEEVFIRPDGRTARHKAGELIAVAALPANTRRLRFCSKQFDFNHGWGIYNQICSRTGYYAAHGTVSFYIDSTERVSILTDKAGRWDAFVEEFFSNVLKREFANALGAVLETRLSEPGFDPAKISNHLSAMSVDMTLMLNGELPQAGEPAFRRHGLRVKRIDIDQLDFYDSGR